uniref:Uncharacterized protein n=1 Tax=Vombatus ursinus TaxID=29139 RepID=A0A4X2MF86_VOMUR
MELEVPDEAERAEAGAVPPEAEWAGESGAAAPSATGNGLRLLASPPPPPPHWSFPAPPDLCPWGPDISVILGEKRRMKRRSRSGWGPEES